MKSMIRTMKSMRKVFWLGMSLMAMALGACGQSANPASSSMEPTSSAYDPILDVLSFGINEDGASYAVKAATKDIEGAVVVPESYLGLPVTAIDDYAFSKCPKLTRIGLPKTITSISLVAFDGSPSLTGIDVDGANLKYASHEGMLIDAERKVFIRCPEGKSMSASVPSGILGLEAYAFMDCVKVTDVMLPATLTAIGEFAFDGCAELSNIEVDPSNVIFSSLGGVLFNKGQTALLRYPAARRGDYVIPAGVSAIGTYAFDTCASLTSLTLPEGMKDIGDSAFVRCSALTSCNIPNGVISLGSSAFSHCSSLTSVYLPASLTDIGKDAFYKTTALEAIDVSWSNPSYSSQDGVLFDKEGSTVLTYPCGKKGNYDVPFGVTSIADGAFWHCAFLAIVSLPRTVIKVATLCFSECLGLLAIDVEEGNPKFSSIDGCLLDKEGEEFLLCPCGKKGTLSVPEGVRRLGKYCFDGCASLTDISLPESLTSIGERAFYGCQGLTATILPKALEAIDDAAFAKCFALADASYLGNIADWQKVEKGFHWYGDMATTKVRCLDGDAPIED